MKEVNFKQKLYTLSTSFVDDGSVVNSANVRLFFDMKYFRINGLSHIDSEESASDFLKILKVLSGTAIAGVQYQYILMGNGHTTYIVVGVQSEYFTAVEKMYTSMFDGIEIAEINDSVIRSVMSKCVNGGTVCGYPSVGDDETEKQGSSVSDALIKGMAGDHWVYCVSAKAIEMQQADDLCQATRDELQVVVPHVRTSIGGQGIAENEQKELMNYDAKEYQENLEELLKKLNYSRLEGAWNTSIFFASDSPITLRKMGGIIRAELGGEHSVPYPIKVVYFDRMNSNGLGLFLDEIPQTKWSFMMEGMPREEEPYCFFSKKYQTLFGSRYLAKAVGIPTEECPGFFMNVPIRFDSAPRRDSAEFRVGDIVYGGKVLENVAYEIAIKSLTKHCLINGITGGGKSNTSKYLLTTLYEKFDKPFLVIESAKQEYYELGRILKTDVFNVFTLGYEGLGAVPYRINPFERIGTVSLQSHIDYLLSSFKASFEMEPPMPYILEAGVYAVYKDYGWDVVSDTNIKGRKDYPTLEDLYYKFEIIVDDYGYNGELKSNIISALQARIGSLRIGGKGAMLNTPVSYPISELLKHPTVLELDAIGDDEVKAFVISMIMVQLYEYRKSEMKDVTKKDIQHVLIIEEAHRLLKNVSAQSGAASQLKAVEFFCNMLAEIRSYGQAIFVADQMPTKLAPDVLKNTNLKICHRIVTKEDRNLLGSAMNMSEEQIEAISMFKTGYAAVYSEGDSRPVLVKIPLMKDRISKTRAQILDEARSNTKKHLPTMLKKKGDSIACSLCTSCKYMMRTQSLLADDLLPDSFLEMVQNLFSYCDDLDHQKLDEIFEVLEWYAKRKMLPDEKLCFVNQYEGEFMISDSYLRAELKKALYK